jgi:hypothetical protein
MFLLVPSASGVSPSQLEVSNNIVTPGSL